VRAHAVVGAHRLLGVRDGDVHVQPEGRLTPSELAHRRVQELVARAGGDLDLLPQRERVRAGHRRAHAERLEHGRQPDAQLAQLCGGVRDRGVRDRGELERRAVRLGRGAAPHVLGQRLERLVGARVEPPCARLEQHHLLLDADRPRRVAPGLAPIGPVRGHAARTTARRP
jgi:hypothetical protein